MNKFLTGTSSTTSLLAEFSANITYSALPDSTINILKGMILDSLGTALAGSTLGAGCDQVVDIARKFGGSAESTLLGFDLKVPAIMAALANGALVHSLNYDAIGAEVGHLGVTALVPQLAIAERKGGVTGKEFLAAAAAATEIVARITKAIVRANKRPSEKFLSGQLLNYFGAAAGAGRVLGLNPTQMHSAFGLALMQASGSMQLVIGGDPPAKAIYGAFPNHGGVLSALLSHAGLGAEYAVFEGEAGLYGMVYDNEYDNRTLVEGLGEIFHLSDVTFKRWPTSGVVHPYIELALQIFSSKNFDFRQIKKVMIKGDQHILPWCEPLIERRTPQNGAAAGNSIPFGIAKALVNGKVTPWDFTLKGMMQAEALQVAQLIEYTIDEKLVDEAIIEIAMEDGAELASKIGTPQGHLAQPVTHLQVVDKFRNCAEYSAVKVKNTSVEEVIQFVENIETASDVSKLTALLSNTKKSKK